MPRQGRDRKGKTITRQDKNPKTRESEEKKTNLQGVLPGRNRDIKQNYEGTKIRSKQRWPRSKPRQNHETRQDKRLNRERGFEIYTRQTRAWQIG
jgi:hypothetical protein